MSSRIARKKNGEKVKTAKKHKSEESKDKPKTAKSNDKTRSSRAKKQKKTRTKKEQEEFETREFLIKHFRVPHWENFHGFTYEPSELHRILDLALLAVQKDQQLAKISFPVTIVGDLNGQFPDLIRIFNMRGSECHAKYPFVGEKFVFLGDYTEIAEFNLETISLLLGLKVLFEKRYILLRGHQETLTDTLFKEQLHKKFGKHSAALWSKFERIFYSMPMAAIISDKILCVHGGVSSLMKNSLQSIREMPKSTDLTTVTPLMKDMLYSTTLDDAASGAESDEPLYITSETHAHVKMFNEAVINKFCAATGVQLVVRSHDVPLNGFQFFAEQKLVTIFSTPMFNNFKNKAAILKVDRAGNIAIIQMRCPGGYLEKPKDGQAPPRKKIRSDERRMRPTSPHGESDPKVTQEESQYDNISERVYREV